MKCIKCGDDILEGTTCPLCGYENGSTVKDEFIKEGEYNSSNSASEESDEVAHPMKWYKLLKVILWVGMVSNIIMAYTYFTGLDYQGFEDELYMMLPLLKSLDAFGGVFCIIMVIFGYIVWYSLKKYKKNAPKLLIIMYVANIIFSAIYMFSVSSIIGSAKTTILYGDSYVIGMYQYQEYLDLMLLSSSLTELAIVQIVVGIGIAVANYNYFKKRKGLFVN